ncbi:hypothetical protein [Cellulomonas sp. KRMCY2]|uniref:hypothetical protein n=1 Tax=Cellulomonas sp. KRMCY2 TaxID=1304865 RepID=UPI00045E9CA3|nr:hypothetical protein [Cellulomonas sp. KRMCY2]
MTTYADLLGGAAEQIRIGAGQLRTDTFWSADDALDVIGDFHAVLDAVASHTRRLLWPAQIHRIGFTSHRDGLPPNERAAIALAACIEALVGQARPHPSQLTPATTPWLRAALQLRAASDLVATHFHPDGRPRTPDAAATNTRAFDAGLVDLGHLAATILSAEEPLALRALQADVSKTVVIRHLPGLGYLADLARDLSTTDDGLDPSARTRLEALPQTWTPIRTDDPATELGDRMHRLRQATFDMAAEAGDTLATLRDVTTIGIAVHAHAAAFHGAQPTTALDPSPGARGAGALILRGRAWQWLHRELSHFVTLAPPHETVRDDLVALSRLLPALAPLTARASSATLADPASRRIGASLNGAVATMTDIGEHSAAAFADLARSGALRLNARDLPRGLVSDDAELVQDRLRGALVRAPDAVVEAIHAEFDIVHRHPAQAPPASPPPVALPGRPGLVFEPISQVSARR